MWPRIWGYDDGDHGQREISVCEFAMISNTPNYAADVMEVIISEERNSNIQT